ncbi:MAG: HNH endonuclease [Firmicutes bacterium]|nr:HNH endonuclease [Bacillota bacterium]
MKEDYKKGKLSKYINFWTLGMKKFKALEAGDLFLFKLHNRKSTGENGEIVGGAFFSHYEILSIYDAWEKYGRGNGRESLQVMQDSLKEMREKNNLQSNISIGCIILKDAFFFDKWIDEPIDWNKNIVSGKKYYTDEQVGAELYRTVWNCINGKYKSDEDIIAEIDTEMEALQLEGQERLELIKVRVNQSVFRDRVLNKYHTCCLCKMENPALLKASHIKPWVASSSKEKLDVENGLLLCPNHDALFDAGFISFLNDGNIIISKRLSSMDCRCANIDPSMKISLSDANKKYIEYHRKNVFFDEEE